MHRHEAAGSNAKLVFRLVVTIRGSEYIVLFEKNITRPINVRPSA